MPLRSELLSVGRQSHNLVPQKNDELGFWDEFPYDGIDRSKVLFVGRSGDAGTGIAIDNELVTFPPWLYRGNLWKTRIWGRLGHEM